MQREKGVLTKACPTCSRELALETKADGSVAYSCPSCHPASAGAAPAEVAKPAKPVEPVEPVEPEKASTGKPSRETGTVVERSEA